MWYTLLLERNLLPDAAIRFGIRRLLRQRLAEEDKGNPEARQEHLMNLIEKLKSSPIAINTGDANEQHYEVPSDFFSLVLGKYMKYSSGYWDKAIDELDSAERRMLELTCERAEIKDGQKILELGCGWGSLSLFMAERYPNSRITAVSNSHSQKRFIEGSAQGRKINNLTVITADMNDFETDGRFDRVVSVEMFEHMRNYRLLLEKINGFMAPGGKLFVHIFTHKEYTYTFDVRDESDWMSKYFFTGGVMPADHLLFYFNDHLRITGHWIVNGTHYSRTAEAWLNNMDKNKNKIIPILKATYGAHEAEKWWVYWRMFFMSCAELWGYKKGAEWFVSHYLLSRNGEVASESTGGFRAERRA